LEALIILPSHMAHTLRRRERRARDGRGGRVRQISAWAERARDWFFHGWLAKPYARFLDACLRVRYLTTALFVAALIACLGLVAGGRVPFDFLASADSETILVNLKMPVG